MISFLSTCIFVSYSPFPLSFQSIILFQCIPLCSSTSISFLLIENAGVVVASEFSTISSLLSGSLKINPFYALHVADTLDKVRVIMIVLLFFAPYNVIILTRTDFAKDSIKDVKNKIWLKINARNFSEHYFFIFIY